MQYGYSSVTSGFAALVRARLPCGVTSCYLRGLMLAACCLIGALPAAAQTGALEVRVTASSGAPIPDADVSVRLRGDTVSQRATTTDSAGRARFAQLRAGRYVITATRLGYYPAVAEVIIAVNLVARVDLVARDAAVGLPGVRVEAERRRSRFEEGAGATVSELTQRDLKLLPALGEADVLRAIEVLPGVVSTSDFSSSFNVRGGSADQNLILLDGLPLYNPFHLGGMFSVFNADMVARAELLAGGFPARYGGRVASVLNVESHGGGTGTEVHAGVSVLATRAAIGVDIPASALERVGMHSGRVRVSGRRSYFDKLLKPLFDFPYHLTDLQLHAESWTNAGGRVTITGYTGRDVLNLTGVDSFPLRVRWDWGNSVVGASWITPIGNGRTLDVRVGHSRFDTHLGFPEFGDTQLRSEITHSLVRADVIGAPGATRFEGGIALERLRYDNLAASAGTVFGQGDGRGWMTSAYAQMARRSESFLLETGLRADAWWPRSQLSHAVLQPRLALKYFVHDNHALKLAAGRYAQFAHSLRDEELPLGIDVWVLSGDRAPAVVSDQIQLGTESNVGSWFAALEAYYRKFDGVTANNMAEDPNQPLDDLLKGRGRSYGADLHIRREQGRIRPMLALSWLKAFRSFDDLRPNIDTVMLLSYPPIFDRRLDVDLVIQAMLPRGIELGARWNLGTGVPYTRPVGAYLYYEYSALDGRWRSPGSSDTATAVVLGDRNAERYPTYHRLDIGARRMFTKKWGTITPYADVINVYDKRNVLFYFYQYGRNPPRRAGISMFPLLPTLGAEIVF